MANLIEQQAIDFANVPIIQRGIKASVHLEDWEDVLFWDTMIQRVSPGRYNYLAYSKAGNGERATGSSQCLRYMEFLSERFFVCIDSDMRYLLNEAGIDSDHFISQTYTYSWENHYCLAEQVQKRLVALSPEAATKFDFGDFLSQLSQNAYEPLLYLLGALDKQLVPSNIVGTFNDCFPLQCTAAVLGNSGAQLISQIKADLRQFVCNPAFAQIDIAFMKEKYRHLGLTESNAYLHIRGKNIFGLLAHIGNIVCRPYKINFKDNVLLPSLQLSGYWEIDTINADIVSVLN